MTALSLISATPESEATLVENIAPYNRRQADTVRNQTQHTDRLLADIMPLAGLAVWDAWTRPLELISLDVGKGSPSPFSLDAAQLQPGTSWDDAVYPADREIVRTFLEGPARVARSIDYRLIIGEGELLWVRHWLLSRMPGRGTRRHIRGLIMAIPEQKHLEWECLRVSERACNRIGQDLHDDLCQVLAGITFMMRVLAQRVAHVAPGLAPEFDELNQELVGATNRVRSMAHGLFPAQLNYGTLRHALNEFARQTKTRFPVAFNLKLPRQLAPHSSEQIIHVYRIAQEAVSNSVRHGNATVIRMTVTSSGRQMQLRIEDNGKGFPIAAARPEGIGMHVMLYRASVLGGRLSFRNLTPQGAVVEIRYPVGQSSQGRHRKTNQPK
jgi:signal transduction histidine kinase